MKVAILGTGSIGSTFAFHLARHGDEVTAIARGKRLEQLYAENAIVTVDGQSAAVTVRDALDPTAEFDLVLVTVLASQVQAVLPSLSESRAKKVMFMFNTFESLSPLREAVGPERFAFGFPAIGASLPDGRLKFTVVKHGLITIATDARLAKAFTAAGIPTAVEADIESWLRSHAAVVVPMIGVALLAHARQVGVSWGEAKAHALAMREGFALVRRLGNTLKPGAMAVMNRLPTPVISALFWALSRTKFVRDLGLVGPSEARTLADAMIAAAPDHSPLLRSIRP